MSEEKTGITGEVTIELFDEFDNLKHHEVQRNVITDVGLQYYAGRAVLAAGQPAQVTGFKLGTGSTTPTPTGAGAALVAYLPTSNKANDGGFPTAVAGVVTWKRTYGPGEATTASAITEVVLVTEAIANDDTSTAAETISRVLIAGVASKAAGDTLVITWTHTFDQGV